MPQRDEIPAPLDHGQHCQRRHPPVLRLTWDGWPEFVCPDCGHTTALPIPERNKK